MLIAVTLGIGILIGTLFSGRALATHDQAATGATLLAVPDPVILSNAFSGISKKIGPAVVNISTTQIIESPKPHRRSRSRLTIRSRISTTSTSISRMKGQTRNAAWAPV